MDLTEPTNQLTIIADEPELLPNSKGPWGATGDLVRKVAQIGTEQLENQLALLCAQINTILGRISTGVGQYGLDSFEFTAELTTKGEIRLVGSVSSEVKGGLKLTFRRGGASPTPTV